MNVWKKQDLPKSDSQQPSEGSNPTCNLRLSQAGYIVDGHRIDQTTYFRNHVFCDCAWEETENGEKTNISVDLEIAGKFKGRYNGSSHELETAEMLGMKAIQAVWYFKEGTQQPAGRKNNFLRAESPLEIIDYIL